MVRRPAASVPDSRSNGSSEHQPNLAARPMKLAFERAVARALARRQSFVENASARSGSPARASASASAILVIPSNTTAFCSRRLSTPRGAWPRVPRRARRLRRPPSRLETRRSRGTGGVRDRARFAQPISPAASRGSDGRLRLHVAVARTRCWRRAAVTGSRRGVRQCGKARRLGQRMANALPSPGPKSLWPILVVRESLTARQAIRREIPLVRIHLAPPRIKCLILHTHLTSRGSISRLFPEACGGCIFASPRRDDFSAIL